MWGVWVYRIFGYNTRGECCLYGPFLVFMSPSRNFAKRLAASAMLNAYDEVGGEGWRGVAAPTPTIPPCPVDPDPAVTGPWCKKVGLVQKTPSQEMVGAAVAEVQKEEKTSVWPFVLLALGIAGGGIYLLTRRS